jgi:hypothetical protein
MNFRVESSAFGSVFFAMSSIYYNTHFGVSTLILTNTRNFKFFSKKILPLIYYTIVI